MATVVTTSKRTLKTYNRVSQLCASTLNLFVLHCVFRFKCDARVRLPRNEKWGTKKRKNSETFTQEATKTEEKRETKYRMRIENKKIKNRETAWEHGCEEEKWETKGNGWNKKMREYDARGGGQWDDKIIIIITTTTTMMMMIMMKEVKIFSGI